MVFHPQNLKLTLLAFAMEVVVLSAWAQPSDRSIIFSTPKSDEAPAAAPSLTPQNSQLPVLPDSLQAPDPVFHYSSPSTLPVAPPVRNVTPHSQQMEKMLEDRKNWTLLTPAEIMGVTPADQLFQSPDRDTLGRKKNMTPLERLLDHETQMRGGLTNGWQNVRDNSYWKTSRNREDGGPFDPGGDNTIDAAKKLSEYLTSRRMGEGTANRSDKNYGWDSFSPPASQTLTKPDLEQTAAMDRFRQLLNPTPMTATESSPDNKYFPLPKTAPASDPFITQPDFVPNPAGSSFTPLTSGLGKPAGLTPLPGIVSPGIAPSLAPSWAPQPAPWLSQGPQPFVMPQRKF